MPWSQEIVGDKRLAQIPIRSALVAFKTLNDIVRKHVGCGLSVSIPSERAGGTGRKGVSPVNWAVSGLRGWSNLRISVVGCQWNPNRKIPVTCGAAVAGSTTWRTAFDVVGPWLGSLL